MKLNLGCADTFLPGYVNVDRVWIRPDPLVGTSKHVTLCCGADHIGETESGESVYQFGWGRYTASPVEYEDGMLFQLADLEQDWIWEDSSAEHVIAHDLIEHLPDRIHTMNELWRVLQPEAQAEIVVPNAYHGAGFMQDPTHKSMWCRNSFQYFLDGSFAHRRLARFYGIAARFKVIGEIEDREYPPDPYEPVWKIHVTLEAVKD